MILPPIVGSASIDQHPSAPTLAERQRRRQIIDLLAGRLARMAEGGLMLMS